jgi:predicted molibdopterin-dependent oxidoreductase YjgC
MLKITIDGKTAKVPDGISVLDAARRMHISIPTLCHHPKLTPFGGCRLCLVEIKGVPRPVTSCTTPVTDGMEVVTTNTNLETLRKTVLELILSDHPNDCMVCERAGDCTLQELAYSYGIRENRLEGERRIYAKRDGNHFIERDMEKCIMCGRCVKVCDEVEGVGAIDFAYRGFKSKICPPFERDLDCEFCGQCVAVCPTGALTGKSWKQKGRQKDVRGVDTTCGYCGCGCSLTLHVKDNEVIRVDARADTLNEGWLCVKGRFGYTFISDPERLKKPLIRVAPKTGDESRFSRKEVFREASWEEAFDYVAENLKKIKEKHGPDALAGLSSARCTNEENYLFQKFIRGALGTNNVDHCARY